MKGPPSDVKGHRFVLAALLFTVGILGVDLVGGPSAPGPSQLRRWGAAAFGPVERLALGGLSLGGRVQSGRVPSPGTPAAAAATAAAAAPAAAAAAAADVEALRSRLREAEEALADATASKALLAADSTAGATLVLARVVGLGAPRAGGPERMTIDVGSRDGIEVDRTVVADGGLVGRVVSVGPWTSDVLLIGAPDLAVGVRVGEAGPLGEVTGGGIPGGGPRARGQVGLALIQPGELAAGAQVRTVGSVGGRPFVAGVLVGTIASVDSLAGRLAGSAVVTPAVDATRLRVVGVLLTSPRVTPRPRVTGGSS